MFRCAIKAGSWGKRCDPRSALSLRAFSSHTHSLAFLRAPQSQDAPLPPASQARLATEAIHGASAVRAQPSALELARRAGQQRAADSGRERVHALLPSERLQLGQGQGPAWQPMQASLRLPPRQPSRQPASAGAALCGASGADLCGSRSLSNNRTAAAQQQHGDEQQQQQQQREQQGQQQQQQQPEPAAMPAQQPAPAPAPPAWTLPREPPEWVLRTAATALPQAQRTTAIVLNAARGVAPSTQHPLAAWTPTPGRCTGAGRQLCWPAQGWYARLLGLRGHRQEQQAAAGGGDSRGSERVPPVATLLERGMAAAAACGTAPSSVAPLGQRPSPQQGGRNAAKDLAQFDVCEVAARLLTAAKPKLVASLPLRQRVLRWTRTRQSTIHRALAPRLRSEVEAAGPPTSAAYVGRQALRKARCPETGSGDGAGSGAGGSRRPSCPGRQATARLGQQQSGAAQKVGRAEGGSRSAGDSGSAGGCMRSLLELHKTPALNGSWEDFAAVAQKLRCKRGKH